MVTANPNLFFYLHNQKKNNAKDFFIFNGKNIYQKTIEQMKLLLKFGIDSTKVNIKKFQNGIWKIRTKDSSNNVCFFFYEIEKNFFNSKFKRK